MADYTLQIIFHKAVANCRTELCNQLLKRGAFVDTESITSCFHHDTTFMLGQLWNHWHAVPKKLDEYEKLSIAALETFGAEKKQLTYESNRVSNHIKFIIDKIDSVDGRHMVASSIIKYIACNYDSDVYTPTLLILLTYVPVTLSTAPQIDQGNEINIDFLMEKKDDEQS